MKMWPARKLEKFSCTFTMNPEESDVTSVMIRMPKAMAPPRRKLRFFWRLRFRRAMRTDFMASLLLCLDGLDRLDPQGHAHGIQAGHDADRGHDQHGVEHRGP